MGRLRDLAGQKFGRMTVISRQGSTAANKAIWLCKCECGTTKTVRSENLITGNTVSCGCLRRENSHEAAKAMHAANMKPIESARNRVKYQYEHGAYLRNLDFFLSEAEFDDLILGSCFYCGTRDSNVSRTASGTFEYSGIDRVDSKKGYEVSNCVSCCNTCNMMKKAMSFAKFIVHVKKIYNHIGGIFP